MNGCHNGNNGYNEMESFPMDLDSPYINKKVFNDAIHGTIEMHPLCVKIVDTPQFQRLRFIKQVGPCYFVFPSAAHNRFEHCVGVSYLARELATALQQRQKELNINEKDILSLEIAGLCHDLGHGPFSHLWDKFIKRQRPELKWRHEDNSVRMLEYLIEDNNLLPEFKKHGLGERDLIFIKEAISMTEPADTDNWQYKGRPKEKRFLYEIVANKTSGIDVDKWDYFLRDGHGLGVKVMFDYKRLVQFSRVINSQICYRDKEDCTLRNMFSTREILHRIAYQHKVAKILDSMILDALTFADNHIKYRSKRGKLLILSEVIDDPFAMTYLHDDVLHTIYRSDSSHEDMVKAKAIVHRIFTRQLYPYIGHAGPVNSVTSQQLLNCIIKYLKHYSSPLTEEDIEIQVKSFDHGAGDKNPLDNVRFFSKSDHSTSEILLPRQTSNMYPVVFEEQCFQLICKKDDPKIIEEAKNAFQSACISLNLNVSMNAEPSKFTPEKKNDMKKASTPVRNLEKKQLEF